MERAREIAGRLDQLNAERQEEERRIMDSIERRLEEEPALREAYCVVLDGEGWHRGVIGITASRVVERHGRPTLVISCEATKRTARAIDSGVSSAACDRIVPRAVFPLRRTRARGWLCAASANVEKLRVHLDDYARARLTAADFEPQLEFDRSCRWEKSRLNFIRRCFCWNRLGWRIASHFRCAGGAADGASAGGERQACAAAGGASRHGAVAISAAAQDFTPRCHPDAAAIPKRRAEATLTAEAPQSGGTLSSSSSSSSASWRDNIAFKAMDGAEESCDRLQLLAGDRLDIAYSLGMNDHPEFGGLELTLRDVVRAR